MSMEKCKECREYIFDWKPHKCEPIFEVLHEEYNGDEWMEQRGVNHEDVAVNYAEHYNQDDYPLMDGGEAKIKVRNPEDGSVKEFIISAEPDIVFYASEIITN